jgi:hypothetical protein
MSLISTLALALVPATRPNKAGDRALARARERIAELEDALARAWRRNDQLIEASMRTQLAHARQQDYAELHALQHQLYMQGQQAQDPFLGQAMQTPFNQQGLGGFPCAAPCTCVPARHDTLLGGCPSTSSG